MNPGWEFHAGERVARFLAKESTRDRVKLLAVFERMTRDPRILPSDLRKVDAKGRPQWLRFSDGFAIVFWLDHWNEKFA